MSLELADEERSLVAALARDDNERKEGAKAKTKGRSRSFAALRMTAWGNGLVQAWQKARGKGAASGRRCVLCFLSG